MKKATVFIDGESGTTGLEIRKRLESRPDIEIVSIALEKRKDLDERRRLLNSCDLAVLCLPDQAAIDAVSMIENPNVRVIDASTAHRTAPGWVYGFPELTATQKDKIRNAKRVSNPGCYPTGALALLRPLVEAEILPASHGVTITAISGYSGGGKELIAICESPETKGYGRGGPYCLYGVDQHHKHLPEIKFHSGLEEDPIFLPAYSHAFYRGMLIQIALRLKGMKRQTGTEVTGQVVHKALVQHYSGQSYIKVEPLEINLDKNYVVSPLDQNETNNVQIRSFWNPEKQIIILTACLDNLGKGASGAAVQNMEIMLGLES